MKKDTISRLMQVLIGTSTTLILIGAFFRLQHYPYGFELLWTGFISNLVLSTIEINRLRKIILQYQSKNQ